MLTIIRNFMDLLSNREKFILYLLLVTQCVMALIELAGIASIMPFMAVVANPKVIQTNRWLKQAYDFFGFTNPKGFFFFMGMLVLGLLVFSNIFKTLNIWWTLKFDNMLYHMTARRLLASYLARPYEFFLNRNTAEMGKNVLIETITVVGGILEPGMQVLSSGVISFLIIVLLLAVNPFIAISIALVFGGCYALIFLIVSRRLTRLGKDQIEANVMKFKSANESLGGIKDLKILGRELALLERFAFHAQRHAKINVSAGILSQLPRYAMETIAFSGILLIVLINLGSEKTIEHMAPLLALYAYAGYRLLPALQQIFAGISKVRISVPALELLHRDMREGNAATDADNTLKKTQDIQPLPLTHELVVKNVTFYYPGAQEPAIKEINLTIATNTSIGLVGATGSGKTTIVDIILGLLKQTSGRLLVDGLEISDDNLPRWQRNLGYVPQQIYLSDDTITHNIAYGILHKEIDMDAVIRAARIANLHWFIEKELPYGFETVIGERGVRLSGGQRQRIGIARALYHDPGVLIMDEATSALDGITEEAVMEALRTLSGEKTIITIAHRLTTVKDCDVIYLMDNGRIVSQGTYDELLKYSSWFQEAARLKN